MMLGSTKHQIKRAWRLFCVNERIETADAMRGIVAPLLKKRDKKKKPLIAVDWVILAKQQFKPAAWCSTNRDIECSIYTIGMIMLEKIDTSPPQAFQAIVELSGSVAPNWG